MGLTHREVGIPQIHPETVEDEVNSGQFEVSTADVQMRWWMFVLHPSSSSKAVRIAYANQAQESFLDGHVKAFVPSVGSLQG